MKNPKLTRDRYRSFIEFDVDSNRKIRIGQEGNDLYIENNGVKHYLKNSFLTFADNILDVADMASMVDSFKEFESKRVITEDITLDYNTIVGTAEGQIGHANGAVLIPGETGYVLQLLGAVLFFTYGTSAYTAGGDDLVISHENGTAMTPVILKADLLGAAANKITMVAPVSSADFPLTDGKPLSLRGTAYTRTTATGTLTVRLTYIKHAI